MTTVEQTEEVENNSSAEETGSQEESQSPKAEDNSELEQQLAAEKELRQKAENDANMWKGRLNKAQKSLSSDDEEKKEEAEQQITESDDRIAQLEWKLENKDRINLVKEDYEKILNEGYNGEKVSHSIALELAEKVQKVDNSSIERSESMGSAPQTENRGEGDIQLTNYEQRMGIKPETKKKYRQFVEGK